MPSFRVNRVLSIISCLLLAFTTLTYAVPASGSDSGKRLIRRAGDYVPGGKKGAEYTAKPFVGTHAQVFHKGEAGKIEFLVGGDGRKYTGASLHVKKSGAVELWLEYGTLPPKASETVALGNLKPGGTVTSWQKVEVGTYFAKGRGAPKDAWRFNVRG